MKRGFVQCKPGKESHTKSNKNLPPLRRRGVRLGMVSHRVDVMPMNPVAGLPQELYGHGVPESWSNGRTRSST